MRVGHPIFSLVAILPVVLGPFVLPSDIYGAESAWVDSPGFVHHVMVCERCKAMFCGGCASKLFTRETNGSCPFCRADGEALKPFSSPEEYHQAPDKGNLAQLMLLREIPHRVAERSLLFECPVCNEEKWIWNENHLALETIVEKTVWTRADLEAALDYGEEFCDWLDKRKDDCKENGEYVLIKLEGKDLTGITIDRTKTCMSSSSRAFTFFGFDFSGADFSGAWLGAIFEKCIFNDTNFLGSSWNCLRFNECEMSEVNFSESRGWAAFEESNLTKANFAYVRGNLGRAASKPAKIFCNSCNLSNIFACHTRIEGNFFNCNLERSDFSLSILSDCEFINCYLLDSKFFGSQLGNVKFESDCRMEGIDMNEAELSNCIFPPRSNINLEGAELANVVFE